LEDIADQIEIFNRIVVLTPLLILFIGLFVLAWWGKHPVLFMITGGYSFIMGCYMPDVLTQGVTNNISVSASLMMFIMALTCWAFAFNRMFARGNNG